MQAITQIEASALSVERAGRIIFAGLDFRLSAGEALLIKGPNGAGKSTLLRAFAGFLPLAAGAIAIGPKTQSLRAERCHYIGDADALKPALTLAENLAFYSALLGGGGIDRALAQLGLGGIAHLPAGSILPRPKRRP